MKKDISFFYGWNDPRHVIKHIPKVKIHVYIPLKKRIELMMIIIFYCTVISRLTYLFSYKIFYVSANHFIFLLSHLP
jgi:hypothetical protein